MNYTRYYCTLCEWVLDVANPVYPGPRGQERPYLEILQEHNDRTDDMIRTHLDDVHPDWTFERLLRAREDELMRYEIQRAYGQ